MYAPHNAALSSSSEKDSDECDESISDDNSCVFRGKWMYDGCTSIDEMIDALRREIALLEDLKRDGWTLIERVEDDYAYLSKNVAE